MPSSSPAKTALISGLTHKTRIYQASTSELYGLVQEVPQKESTPFYPRSPYGMVACNGILFNLDSLRDWGHARDDVEMQWRMLRQEGHLKTS